jgi:hypothetical protein
MILSTNHTSNSVASLVTVFILVSMAAIVPVLAEPLALPKVEDFSKIDTAVQKINTRLTAAGDNTSSAKLKAEFKAFKLTAQSSNIEAKSEAFIKVTDEIHIAADALDSYSNLRIKSRPHTGQVVKYQTLGQRRRGEPAMTAGQPTDQTSVRTLNGYYHIWCEKDGIPTSDRNSIHPVLSPTQTITLILNNE